MKQLAKKLNLRYENIDACAAGGAPDLSEETFQRLYDATKQRVRAKQEHSTVIEAVQDLIGPWGSRFYDLFGLVIREMDQEICRTFAEFSRDDIGSHPSQEYGSHSSLESGSYSSQDSADDYDEDPDYASDA